MNNNNLEKKIDVIILARGGSKGIPRKNVLPFLGVPLVELSIRQALNSKLVRNVYLSSDNSEILSKADSFKEVIQVKRPDYLATDDARSEDAVIHWLNNSLISDLPDIVIMLEPTAPLRKPNDIDDSIKAFIEQGVDSLFSGAFLDDFLIWKRNNENKLISVNYDYKVQGPRQMRKPDIVENGALYLFTPQCILQNSNRFGGKIGHYKNDFWQSFEIDSPDDWKFLEIIYANYINFLYD